MLHKIGEYSALCFAGAFSFEDGVRLTKARGQAMQAAADASQSGMVAIIGLDSGTVQKICDLAAAQSGESISIANYLGDGNYAISGSKVCAVSSRNSSVYCILLFIKCCSFCCRCYYLCPGDVPEGG